MSDDAEASEASEAQAPAGPRTPKVVMGLLAANLAVSAVVLMKTITAPPVHVAAAHAETAAKTDEISGPIGDLDPFVVNLNEPGSSRYLKVHIQFELANGESAHAFEKSKLLIRDQILGYLSALTVADTQGAENKDKIRDELVRRVGDLIGRQRVRRPIFAEFVVQ